MTTPTTEYGYRLAHAFERETVGGFTRATDAWAALHDVLSAQKGSDGMVLRRDSKDEPWRPVGRVAWWWSL